MTDNFIFLKNWVALKRVVGCYFSYYVCRPLYFLLECSFCRSDFNMLTSRTDACQDGTLLRIVLTAPWTVLMRQNACMLQFSISRRLLSGPALSTMEFYLKTARFFPNLTSFKWWQVAELTRRVAANSPSVAQMKNHLFCHFDNISVIF